MLLALLEMAHGQAGEFVPTESAREQEGQQCPITLSLHPLMVGCLPECLPLIGGQPVSKPDAQLLDALDPPYSSGKIGAEEPTVCRFVSKTAHRPEAEVDGARGEIAGLQMHPVPESTVLLNDRRGSEQYHSTNSSIRRGYGASFHVESKIWAHQACQDDAPARILSGPANYSEGDLRKGNKSSDFPYRDLVRMGTYPEGILEEPTFSTEDPLNIAKWTATYRLRHEIDRAIGLTVYYHALMLRGDQTPYTCADRLADRAKHKRQ
jgi:hypothetical protein